LFTLANIIVNFPSPQHDLIPATVYNSAKSVFINEPQPIAATVFSSKSSNSVFEKMTDVFPPFPFISLINPDYYTTSISTHLMNRSDDLNQRIVEEAYLNTTPFEIYVSTLKQNNCFISYEDAQESFVVNHKIKYLIIKEGMEDLMNETLMRNFTVVLVYENKSLYVKND
jgi:hypothetical protein